jgi:hypothetical protein
MGLSEEAKVHTRPREVGLREGRGHLFLIGIDQGWAQGHEELVEVLGCLALLIGIRIGSRCFGDRRKSLRDRDGFGAAREERDRRQRHKKSDGEAHPMDPMRWSSHDKTGVLGRWPVH